MSLLSRSYRHIRWGFLGIIVTHDCTRKASLLSSEMLMHPPGTITLWCQVPQDPISALQAHHSAPQDSHIARNQ